MRCIGYAEAYENGEWRALEPYPKKVIYHFLLKRVTFTKWCLKEENLGSILVVCLIIVPNP